MRTIIYGYIDPISKKEIKIIPFFEIPGEKIWPSRNLQLPFATGIEIVFLKRKGDEVLTRGANIIGDQ
ncbi:MAG TPA: hypothetical protein VF581_07800 [Flavobacterium sp.]|jgi:hypothetical protein